MTTPAVAAERTPRRAALASWIGSALEYYDFAVYGTASAVVLNRLFFPPETSTGVSVLLTMGTFGVAYAVRPLGALIVGPLADRLGRRFVLMLTLFMIGAATFAIGCLPTYSQAGLLAPILLVTCRIIQGLSAAGEQASAISVSIEHSDDTKRARTTSWTLHGTQFGTALAVMVFIPFAGSLSTEALESWGWRVPFWCSAVVVVVAYLIRRRLEEPPAFAETREHQKDVPPLKQAFKFHYPAIIRVAGAAMVNTVSVGFTVWSVTFAVNGYDLPRATMLWVPVAANLLALGAIPIAARVADRIGRKPVFVVGVIGPALLMYPYLWSITQGDFRLIFVFGMLMSGLFYSASNAIWPSFYAEMFPTAVRATGLAIGTQIGFAVSGFFTGLALTALAGDDLRNWALPAVYVSAMCAVSLIAVLSAKETAFRTLEQIDQEHTSADERRETVLPTTTYGSQR